MNNEIVTIRENMMMKPKKEIKNYFKIILVNNVKQFLKYCHGMNVNHLPLAPPPPPPIVVNSTLYMYFLKN
jgi:hypothetical protein